MGNVPLFLFMSLDSWAKKMIYRKSHVDGYVFLCIAWIISEICIELMTNWEKTYIIYNRSEMQQHMMNNSVLYPCIFGMHNTFNDSEYADF